MNPKTSSDLFNKIRSQFRNIQIGDSTGQPTADPQLAVFFDFEFAEDADTFGRVSVSLADGENMKVFYNRDLVSKIDEDSRDEWYAFLKELKDFAVEHQLAFDVRDITKSNLTKQDYKHLADTNATINTDEMSEEINRITTLAGVNELNQEPKPFKPIKEGLTGTSKSSYENLDKTRLIIRHSGPVDETVPGSRSRHINSLYIENEDGERFKYPITHLAGARAMTRHVANGGRPHDEFGEHIIKTSENIAQLNSFSRYVSHKDQLNDNAGDIIEQTKLKLENLRTYVKNLSKQSHYEAASKDFKPSAIADLSDDERSAYREKFTMKHLDDRVENVLPLIHNIMKEYKPGEGDPDAKVEPPVDHGAIVQGFLTDPDKKLVLRKDDTADKMLSVTKFTNNNTMLGSILSDIASRMLTRDNNEERVANFASRVADGLENEGELFNEPGSDWPKNKAIAIQLARRYIEDYKKMQKDPNYAEQVRMDAKAFAPKKDLKGKPKEDAFEQWADRVTEGTWSLPTPEHAGDHYEELVDIMKNPLEVGTDATNATQTLSSVGFGDDSLYDAIGSLYDNEGEKADARLIVKQYVLDQLVPANHYTDTLSPEMKKGLSQAVSSFKDPSEKQMELPGLERDKENEPMFNGESVTFEDIKPYVSMYKGDDGKTVYDVLDKDEKSVYKTGDSRLAMHYLSKNFNALKKGEMKPEMPAGWESKVIENRSLTESRTKIVESIKNKADTGFNIAGIEGEHDRVTGDAGLQIARMKYLSKY